MIAGLYYLIVCILSTISNCATYPKATLYYTTKECNKTGQQWHSIYMAIRNEYCMVTMSIELAQDNQEINRRYRSILIPRGLQQQGNFRLSIHLIAP